MRNLQSGMTFFFVELTDFFSQFRLYSYSSTSSIQLCRHCCCCCFFRFSNSFTANFQLVVKPFPFVASMTTNPKVIIIAKAIVYQQLPRSFTRQEVHRHSDLSNPKTKCKMQRLRRHLFWIMHPIMYQFGALSKREKLEGNFSVVQ